MNTCFDCEHREIWTVKEDVKCKCKIDGSERNPYMPMVLPDKDCPNWEICAEAILTEGVNLLREKKQLIERLNKTIDGTFSELGCRPLEIYGNNEIHIYKGLQKLADKIGAETHTEPHGNGQKLVCEWHGITFFQLADQIVKGYEYQ